MDLDAAKTRLRRVKDVAGKTKVSSWFICTKSFGMANEYIFERYINNILWSFHRFVMSFASTICIYINILIFQLLRPKKHVHVQIQNNWMMQTLLKITEMIVLFFCVYLYNGNGYFFTSNSFSKFVTCMHLTCLSLCTLYMCMVPLVRDLPERFVHHDCSLRAFTAFWELHSAL